MMHKIGERISAYRKERNMSQEELATVLNVSRQTICKWEKGDTLPDVYNIVALVNIFHISLDTLIFGTGRKNGESSYMSQVKNKRRKTHLSAFIVGSCGTVLFITTIVLLEALGELKSTIDVAIAIVLPVSMLCWGFGIWGLIKTARLSDEIRYLEKIELASLQSESQTKN